MPLSLHLESVSRLRCRKEEPQWRLLVSLSSALMLVFQGGQYSKINHKKEYHRGERCRERGEPHSEIYRSPTSHFQVFRWVPIRACIWSNCSRLGKVQSVKSRQRNLQHSQRERNNLCSNQPYYQILKTHWALRRILRRILPPYEDIISSRL